MALGSIIANLGINVFGVTKDFDKTVAKVEKGSKKMESSFKQVRGQLVKMTAGVAAVTAVIDRMAARGNQVIQVSNAFTRATGAQTASIAMLQKATMGLVTNYQLMGGLNRALALGAATNAAEYAKMAEAAVVLGRALGVDAAFALESVTIGIGRQSRLVLDNIGLIVQAEKAYQRYAESIGVAVQSLTEEQRKEAFRIAALEEIDRKIETLGGTTLTAADAWTRMGTSIANALDNLNMFVARAPLLEGMADFVRKIADGLNPAALSDATKFRVDKISEGVYDPILGMEMFDVQKALEGKLAERKRLEDTDITAWQNIQTGFGASVRQFANLLNLDREIANLEAVLEAIEMRMSADDAKAALTPLDEMLAALADVTRGWTGRSSMPGFDPRILSEEEMRARRLAREKTQGIAAYAARYMPNMTFGPMAVPGVGGAGGGFLDNLWGGIKDKFEPSRVAEQVAGNLLSGGISGVLGAITKLGGNVLSGLFGPSRDDRVRAALGANTEALKENTTNIAQAFMGLSGNDLTQAFGDMDAIIARGFGIGDRFANFGPIRRLGEIADELGIEFVNTQEGLDQFRDALMDVVQNSFQQFGGGFNLLKTEFALLDIDDPAEQFRRSIDFVSSLVSDDLAAVLQQLDASNIDSFITSFLRELRHGDMSNILEQLDNLSIQDFMEFLGFAEGALDRFTDAVDRSANILNSPRGFKGMFTAFAAADSTLPGDLMGGDNPRPFLPFPGAGIPFDRPTINPGTGGGGVSVGGNLTLVLPGVSSVSQLWDEIRREAVRQGGLGAPV